MASISAAPFGRRERVLRVSAQSRVVPLEDERESSEGSGGPSASGIDEKEEAFDPGMPPLFGLTEIRAAIPKSFCVRDPWRSMSYVVCDVVVVLGLAAVSVYINSWIVWPLYWVAQWTMFWGLFVLGHDCGHGSFSNDTKLNSVVGLYFIPPFLFLTTDGELATGLITRIMGMLRMMNRGTRLITHHSSLRWRIFFFFVTLSTLKTIVLVKLIHLVPIAVA